MNVRGLLGMGVQALLAVTILALLAGSLLGQPVVLGFVETGSMEPTLEPGDGFVAIPDAIASDPEPGDVVVFDAAELEGGGLTTHRIVADEERGYVTQGDANPFADQEHEEPHVQDGQIVATVLQVNGEVVAIPHLGTATTTIGAALGSVQGWLANALGADALGGTAGLAYLLLALSIVAYAVETVRERRDRTAGTERGNDEDGPIDPRLLCGAFAALVVVAAAGAMAVPGGTESFDVVSASFESDRPLVIESGTTDEVPYPVVNGGIVPVVSYVVPESDGVAVAEERVAVGSREEAELAVSLTAPEETGHYPMYATEYRYLHVLPAPVIDALFEVHPWLPFLAVLGVFGGGTYALGRLLLGPENVRERRERIRKRLSRSGSRRVQ